MNRELDKKIAEKIMGYPGEGNVWIVTGDYANIDDIPNYSSDISVAWEVVEKIVDTDVFPGYWTFDSSYLGESHGDLNYRAEFTRTYTIGDEESFEQYANSLPEAICLAALKTID